MQIWIEEKGDEKHGGGYDHDQVGDLYSFEGWDEITEEMQHAAVEFVDRNGVADIKQYRMVITYSLERI